MTGIEEGKCQHGSMDRRKRIETDKAAASSGYRSNAMVAGGLVFTGGHIGVPVSTPEDRHDPAETMEEQIDLCLYHMEQLALAGGVSLDRLVEVSAFLTPDAWAREAEVRAQVNAALPVAPLLFNTVQVDDVALHAMMEIDGVAVVDPDITAQHAADILKPFGHDQGMVHSGPFIFLNGLTAPGASLGEQSTNLLGEADRRLKEVSSSLSQAVKMAVYIAEFDIYPEFNDATIAAFADFEPPTRSVLVAPAITGDSLLRIDLVALA